MVAEQLEGRGIVDRRVLDAMGRVPREAFVEERDRNRAYFDMPLRIGWGQTISQPYMVALICQTADVKEGDKVLDIGTGSGYQAAVLAEMGAEVHSVERIPELAERARERLAIAGYERVQVHVGDGSLGLPEEAPFDAIVVAAAFPVVPAPLVTQLAEDGRLVQPIGPGGAEDVTLFRRDASGRLVRERSVIGAHFVPLYGRYGHSADR